MNRLIIALLAVSLIGSSAGDNHGDSADMCIQELEDCATDFKNYGDEDNVEHLKSYKECVERVYCEEDSEYHKIRTLEFIQSVIDQHGVEEKTCAEHIRYCWDENIEPYRDLARFMGCLSQDYMEDKVCIGPNEVILNSLVSTSFAFNLMLAQVVCAKCVSNVCSQGLQTCFSDFNDASPDGPELNHLEDFHGCLNNTVCTEGTEEWNEKMRVLNATTNMYIMILNVTDASRHRCSSHLGECRMSYMEKADDWDYYMCVREVFCPGEADTNMKKEILRNIREKMSGLEAGGSFVQPMQMTLTLALIFAKLIK